MDGWLNNKNKKNNDVVSPKMQKRFDMFRSLLNKIINDKEIKEQTKLEKAIQLVESMESRIGSIDLKVA